MDYKALLDLTAAYFVGVALLMLFIWAGLKLYNLRMYMYLKRRTHG
jgi:hypothetical protein